MTTLAPKASLQEKGIRNGVPAGVAKAVVVHAGARDAYQLALGLSQAGLLESLVTDLFWPVDRTWATKLLPKLSPGLRDLLLRRSAPGLPADQVKQCLVAGLRCLLLDRIPGVAFDLRRRSTRALDATMGKTAGRKARKHGAGLVSYSYCGFDAITAYGRSAMLFQVHPHPATVRRILTEELTLHPECRQSLEQEWELALPEVDFQHLVDETKMASHFLAASSFTRSSLVEHGASAADVTVIPYGVDLQRFHPLRRERKDARLRLLFVGRINQRKGITYLLDALRMLNSDEVQLTVCGRVVDDLQLFKDFEGQIEVRPSVSAKELVEAYQDADLFVFPSVAEGFAQVLLEALASGLPILSTTHTAAPDLITDGCEGFIVEPRDVSALAERIAWAISHRSELREMGEAARRRAEFFTWERFRSGAAKAVASYLASTRPA